MKKSRYTLQERLDRMKELRANGVNCGQTVLAVFDDMTGFDPDTTYRAGAGLGAGLGCGSVCGVMSALGIITGFTYEDRPADKKSVYTAVRQLADGFGEGQSGFMDCRDLKGAGYPCDELIASGIALLHRRLEEGAGE